jgi:16S rRNA (guanine527-N7)-methyltransferase
MESLKEKLLHNKVVLPNQFFKDAFQYAQHIEEWNKVHNLTGAKHISEIYDHIYDSVFPVSFLPQVNNALDIGTGAGFPGLVLAMALKHTHFTLVEPLKKRSSFLSFIVAELKMNNVTVLSKRVEQVPPTSMDLITSRAVTKTKTLLELSQPFLTPDTLLLFYKGEQVFDEIDESLKYKIFEQEKRKYLLIESPNAS